MYRKGGGVEKDKKMELNHLEVAAIGGHDLARHNLGCLEERIGRLDRAVKHWIIAANLGNDGSLDALKEGFKRGLVSKEDFAAALWAHQAAVDATKSPQRAEAKAALLQKKRLWWKQEAANLASPLKLKSDLRRLKVAGLSVIFMLPFRQES
jgi:TPR repeat protein